MLLESAAVSAVAVLILLVVLVVILVLILIGVLVVVLVHTLVILVVHGNILRFICIDGKAVIIGYPVFYALSFALKIKLITNPRKIAVAIPPAEAFKPPVKIPRNPLLETASFTPLAIV